MTEFAERFVTTRDGLRIHVRDYSGSSSRTPVIGIPGTQTNLHTFDFIAPHIAKTRRVLCVGLRGRGRSDYDPEITRYTLATETHDVVSAAKELGVPHAVVLGVSRGGMTALTLAARTPLPTAIILNDAAPQMEATGAARYLPDIVPNVSFPSWSAASQRLKARHAQWFPGMPEEKWLFWARSIYREENGRIIPDSDLRFAAATMLRLKDVPKNSSFSAWPAFQDMPDMPMLLLRGELSDFVLPETAARMKAMKPGLVAVSVKDRGHRPMMDEPDAVAAIDAFLARIP